MTETCRDAINISKSLSFRSKRRRNLPLSLCLERRTLRLAFKDGRCRSALKCDGKRNPFPNIHNKRRPKTSKAVAMRLLADAGINNSC